jgi:hypothetical protein
MRAESTTPTPNRLVAYGNSSMCQEVLNISKTQGEAVIQEDGVGNNLGRKAKAPIDGRCGVRQGIIVVYCCP